MTTRIDKWLYYTRFYKTRALAAKAVAGGHVRVNGSRARKSTSIKRGDTVALVKNQLPWRIRVLSEPTRRGPARDAPSWYEEDQDVIEERRTLIERKKLDRMQLPRTAGRPDRDTRRKLRDRRRLR